jgi:cobalt-zinc-cadmium efflux system outer membrane protein
VVVLLGGCATIEPTTKIGESIDLVEKQTGVRPEWLAPWDDAPPPWDGQSVLSVDQALILALRNNRELRADLETIGQANADLVQAGLLQNPRSNFMAMLPEGGGRAMLRSSGFPLQPLQDLWLRPARQEVAAAELQQAVLRVADRAVQIAAEVKRVYAMIQYAQRATELLQANMDLVDQTHRLVQTQQAAGKATLVEVNVPRIRSLRLRSELLTTEAEYRRLKRQLLMLMGFATAGDAWTVTSIHELDEPVAPPPSEEQLLATAEDHRLDLQAARWAVTAAQEEIELHRREGWPDVAVGLGFERAPAPETPSPDPESSQNETRMVDWTVGPMIDVELPIFDQNRAQVAKAFHVFRQRCAEYDARRQSVAATVREASVMSAQAYDQVKFFREAILPEVERNLEVVRESYRAGREEVTILLQVQEDVLMTRLNALAFLRDLLVNRAELERAVGGRFEASPGGATREPEERSDEETRAR